MSANLPIDAQHNIAAPTPQNTPLTSAPIAQGLSRPTVPDINEDVEDDEDDGEDEDDDEGGILGGANSNAAIQAAMLKMVHGRLGDLVGKSSGYIESLPVEVKRTVEALKGVQVEYENIQMEFKKEMLELEKKYLTKYTPLFERRAKLVSGKAAPTAEEVAAGEAQSLKDDPEHTPLPAVTSQTATAIPEFWLTALRNHLGISGLITDRDAAALKHLKDITVSYDTQDKGTGFVLTFHFEANEFFDNTTLTKTYYYKDEVSYLGDFVYSHATGCAIKWKEDKDLTKEIEIKKQRNKNTNRTRVIRKSKPAESFFNFFDPPVPPKDDIDEDEVDEEEMEALEERLELDYQIGEDLKERVIPRAIDYFTGKSLEYDELSGLESDDEDFDDEDEDEETSESSDDDVPRASKRRGPPAKKGGAGSNNVDPEECKQQ